MQISAPFPPLGLTEPPLTSRFGGSRAAASHSASHSDHRPPGPPTTHTGNGGAHGVAQRNGRHVSHERRLLPRLRSAAREAQAKFAVQVAAAGVQTAICKGSCVRHPMHSVQGQLLRETRWPSAGQAPQEKRRGHITRGSVPVYQRAMQQIQCQAQNIRRERGAPRMTQINISFRKFHFSHYEIWVQGGGVKRGIAMHRGMFARCKPGACPARCLCNKYSISSPKFILTQGSPPSRPH